MLTAVVRFLPVLLATFAAMLYAWQVQGGDAYIMRNLLPMLLFLLLAGYTLYRGQGRWRAGGWRWVLGTAGFAIPALGLSLYLHWGYANDLDGMFSDAIYPRELFRFLPAYTLFAGAIGFAIGWIAGRNID